MLNYKLFTQLHILLLSFNKSLTEDKKHREPNFLRRIFQYNVVFFYWKDSSDLPFKGKRMVPLQK